MYIGIGVAIVGIAAYFIFFKKKKKGESDNGDKKEKDGDKGKDGSGRRMQPFPVGNLRGSDKTPLKKGLQGGKDVEALQSFLNNMSIEAIKKGTTNVPEELVIDGKFGDKTQEALNFHLGKTQISVGELKQEIAKNVLKGGVLPLLRFK